MELRMFENGDVVKSKINDRLEMVVTHVDLINETIDAKYWNEQQNRFEEIALPNIELEKVKDFNFEFKTDYKIGDVVEFRGAPNTKLIIQSNNNEFSYQCRYWNDSLGQFGSEMFYAFEVTEPTGFEFFVK